MNHRKLSDRLGSYLEDELDSRERERLERHLAECAACREELRGLRRTLELLHALPNPEPPPDLAEVVMSRLRSGEGQESAWVRARAWLADHLGASRLVPVAAVAVGLTALGLLRGIDLPAFSGDAASRSSVARDVASESPPSRFAAAVGTGAPRSGARVPSPADKPEVRAPALVASSAPPAAEDAVPLPPLSACLRAARPDRQGAAPRLAAAERESCARWSAWMVGLASKDARAFLSEVENLPDSERGRWLIQLSEFARRSGSAPLLARELHQTTDPRAPGIAVRFERSSPLGR